MSDRGQAEEWLSENWGELVEDGITAVELLDDDGTVVYGMSLLPDPEERPDPNPAAGS